MNHAESTATRASERYLLDEMTEAERFAFEAHYFDCLECADDVRAGSQLVEGIRSVCTEAQPAKLALASTGKAVRRPKFSWSFFAPGALAAALACAVVYQSAWVIPRLKQSAATRALSPVVLRAATRGDTPEIRLAQLTGDSAVLWLDVNGVESGSRLLFTLRNTRGDTVRGETKAPQSGMPLLLLLERQNIQAGVWTLALQDQTGSELGSYTFRISNP